MRKKEKVIMKRYNIKNLIRSTALGLVALVLISCSGYNMIVKMPEVNEVPSGHYEIIKLYNPEGFADKTLAGLVFIKKGASVCTDYPRQEIIKSLDELTMTEKNSYRFFSNYAITAEIETLGFVSIPAEYIAILWKNEKDENCKYKVQVEYINKERGDFSGQRNETVHGGGHGR
jgi:hypothetical protein